MRGEDKKQSSMLMLMSPETRVPKEHPIRRIKKIADAALTKLDSNPRYYSFSLTSAQAVTLDFSGYDAAGQNITVEIRTTCNNAATNVYSDDSMTFCFPYSSQTLKTSALAAGTYYMVITTSTQDSGVHYSIKYY